MSWTTLESINWAPTSPPSCRGPSTTLSITALVRYLAEPKNYFFARLLQIVLNWYFSVLSADRCQFHQHFMRGFFLRKFCVKLFCTNILSLNLFWCKNIGAKALIKCWWNWPQVFSGWDCCNQIFDPTPYFTQAGTLIHSNLSVREIILNLFLPAIRFMWKIIWLPIKKFVSQLKFF